jgi:hypothetical protein
MIRLPLHYGWALVFAAAALVIQPVSPGAESPQTDVAGVIAGVVDAYGGEKAMRAVNGFHASGDQWAAQLDQPIHAERWFARPDRLRLDLAYPDHHEIRLTHGTDGWSGSSPDHLTPANPMKLQAMRLQTARLDIPLRLLELHDKVEARGNDSSDRIVLRLPVDSALYIEYHVDPKTYYITKVTTGMTSPEMQFDADYSEFQKVGGVLVPFHEVTYAGGTMTSKYQMTKFEWNPKDLESHLKPVTKNGN